MSCPKHPKSPYGLDGKISGDCWDCEGRPPHWVCAKCGKHFPCNHYADAVPAMTGDEAEACARLGVAIEAYRTGAGSWDNVERQLNLYARAVRDSIAVFLEKRKVN